MAYTPTTWVDDGAPPISAANLNKLEGGVEDAHTTADTAATDLAAHEANVSNPHAVTAAQAGADPAGTATAAVAAHEAAANPHPGYLTPAEADAAYAATDDARLSDARTPTAHAASHASGGSDAVTPAAIGAASAADLDAKADSTLAINTQTASYALALADSGKVVEMNVAGANTLTVPPNASVAFPVGTTIAITQIGAGQTTVVADTGVTIRTAATLLLRAQYSAASLYQRAADEWVLTGDLQSA